MHGTSVLVGQPQRAGRKEARDSSLRLDRVSRTVGGESAHDVPDTGPVCQNVEWRRRVQGLVFGVIFFLVATFPATWLLMLFAGNVGLHQSYWGTLPLGILVSVLLAGVTKPSVAVIRRERL